jgi:hypothetical protein
MEKDIATIYKNDQMTRSLLMCAEEIAPARASKSGEEGRDTVKETAEITYWYSPHRM